MTRFISIISGEKNTGKTTVALNLGLALHKLNQRVLVLDADFSKPNMIEHLNIDYLPITLDDVFSGNNHIFDSVYKHVSGLKIIPTLTMNDYSKLKYHLQDFLADYDYIIMDTPDDQKNKENILSLSNEALIIHTPEHTSKLIKDSDELIKKHKLLNLGIVMNKSHPEGINSLFGIPILIKIPNNKDITKSFQLKNPLLYTHPKNSISKEFLKLGKMMIV